MFTQQMVTQAMLKIFSTKSLFSLEAAEFLSNPYLNHHLKIINKRGNGGCYNSYDKAWFCSNRDNVLHTTSKRCQAKGSNNKDDKNAAQNLTSKAGGETTALTKNCVETGDKPCKEDIEFLKGNLKSCLKLQSEWSKRAQDFARHINVSNNLEGLQPIKSDSAKVFDAWHNLFDWYSKHVDKPDSNSDSDDDEDNKKIEKYRKSADRDKWPAHVLEVVEEQFTKLKVSGPSASHRTCEYLDFLTSIPWGKYSEINQDINYAKSILDEDYYGLKDVKERILEFIPVGIQSGLPKGKVICLSGPPGVGKTSIVGSIARALGRKFYKFSMGGLYDVDEIKGLSRIYSTATPGKIMKCLKTVGTMNPLILLDEIDKLGTGGKAKIENALLNLLDPEQNEKFLDYYFDFPVDVSNVLFVCTANNVNQISNLLLDRMEIISMSRYTTDEKMKIARDYIDKSVREACGLKPEQAEITDAALLALVENYCREAGVRNLKKHIEKIYRKIALQLTLKGVKNTPSSVPSPATEKEKRN